MKKQKSKSSTRIKRKNAKIRIQAKKANKKPPTSLFRAEATGKSLIKKEIPLYPKALHPNQAIPS